MKANYHIKSTNRLSQFIQIELFINFKNSQTLSLQIPAWRPGRYQLADYAKNIRSFSAKDQSGNPITFLKTRKNRWDIPIVQATSVVINYEYYAGKMDAGSCWVDDEQIYLNFVNCCMEVLTFPVLEYEIQVEIPKEFQSVCTLPKSKSGDFLASDFQQLADSTFLAAAALTHWEYQVASVPFHCWFKGDIHFDHQKFLENFSKFTQRQIDDFGDFPEEEYHFIFQLLPYPHYHGVEHKRGTVITFGPAESLSDAENLEELLGVSSHELYHAWNVCRIRPSELLPYDFSKEKFTNAGWILEGITTYMGDLYLLKSGIYSLDRYLHHLNQVINRAFKNLGWKNYSILESSYDLWLDGYEAGIPDRKVNIYAHGAVIALCLDVILLKDKSSLASVMRSAWQKFGKPNRGYPTKRLWELFLDSVWAEDEISKFYHDYIFGNENIFEKLKTLLPEIGLELIQDTESNPLESKLGIILSGTKITKIHPESPAYTTLMIGDEIDYQLTGANVRIDVKRINGAAFDTNLKIEKQTYFPTLQIIPSSQLSLREKWLK